MDPQDRQDAKAGIRDVRIRGSRLLLRALRPDEIEEEWQAMVTADPMAIAELPEETSFKARLGRSGHLEDGWLDLAIDLEGASIGRIQTFVPQGRPLPPGTFEVGIGLRAEARRKGYGREALALLTDWLFEHAAAAAVEAPTDPANVAMRTVFQRVGWMLAEPLTEFGREWVMYRITRPEWAARRQRTAPGHDSGKLTLDRRRSAQLPVVRQHTRRGRCGCSRCASTLGSQPIPHAETSLLRRGISKVTLITKFIARIYHSYQNFCISWTRQAPRVCSQASTDAAGSRLEGE